MHEAQVAHSRIVERLVQYNLYFNMFILNYPVVRPFHAYSLMDQRQVPIFLRRLAEYLALCDQTNLCAVASASRRENRYDCDTIIIKKVNCFNTKATVNCYANSRADCMNLKTMHD